MRILISTFGTQGDIQPFIALGEGLRSAGHAVTVCTAAGYSDQVAGHGLATAAMHDDLLDLTRALLEVRGGALAQVRRLGRMAPAMRLMLEDEWRAAQAVRPDAIVYHPKMLGSYHIAEKLGVPVAMALPLPLSTPTRAFPYPFLTGVRLGPRFNRLSYRVNTLAAAAFAGLTNAFRVRTLALPPRRRFADPLVRADGAPVPVLYPYSPALLPTPDDFPPHVHVTGAWFVDRPAAWRPDPALERFLAAGPPPVYVGFGSMGAQGATARARMVLEALARSGQRGLLALGWGGLRADRLPDTVAATEAVPHDWLFPQVAAVVHHGGAGTTAAGLRAGRPTVICPFLGDQPFWGALVHARGVGPRPIAQHRLTARRLAAAIAAAVHDPAMRRRAAALGVRMQAEQGVATAVGVIERILRPRDSVGGAPAGAGGAASSGERSGSGRGAPATAVAGAAPSLETRPASASIARAIDPVGADTPVSPVWPVSPV
jgi:sterol 3beta-glucosyltransferase